MFWILGGLAGLFWALPGGAGVGAAQAETYKVVIQDFAFHPPKLTVKVGDTVEFINRDGFAHTATKAGKGGFDTRELGTGKSLKITFRKAGVFNYGCSIHPSMEGQITVKK
ncbi:MAG: cupredoxin family copper-binding protein [Nitrospinota bacterium]